MHEATADSEAALSDLENAFELSRGEYREELLALLAHLADADEQAGERAQARTRRLRLCEVRALGGELDLARDQLLILLKADLRDREVLWQLADLEARAGRWDAVSSSLRRIISVEEGERLVEAALRLAEACDRAGRPEDARGGLERAYKAHPDRTDLRDKLVQAYDAAGAYREWADLVVAEARNAQDVQEQFEGLVHGARVLLKAEDEGAEAVNILEEARGLKPEDPSVTLALSEAYAQSGRSVDARQLLVAAIDGFRARRSVMAARYYEALARIELQDGNLSESLDALHRAFDNDPHNAALALELGRFAIDLDETELATRAFRTLTMMKGSPEGGVSPESRAIAYFHLGQIAHRQGDVRRARLMLEKALVEDPNLAVARELLDSVRGG